MTKKRTRNEEQLFPRPPPQLLASPERARADMTKQRKRNREQLFLRPPPQLLASPEAPLSTGIDPLWSHKEERLPIQYAPCPLLRSLPDDVMSLLAQHVSRGQPTRDTLALAMTTPLQQRQVLAGLPRKLTISKSSTADDVAFWPAVMELSELVIEEDTPILTLLEVLRSAADTLRRVTMPDAVWTWETIGRLPRLRDLSLSLRQESSMFLSQCLSQMKSLKILTLICKGCTCAFDHHGENQSNNIAQTLALACPKLEQLMLECGCSHTSTPSSIWFAVPKILSLKNVRIVSQRRAPGPALRILESFPRLELTAPNALHIGTKLGRRVTVIHNLRRLFVGHADIERLSVCANLTSLFLLIEVGVEESLAAAMLKLPKLRFLGLVWTTITATYPTPFPGTVLKMIQSAPQLVEVKLGPLRICSEEVKAILEHMGSRLKIVGLPMLGQDEPPLERLQTMLCTILQHNKALKLFRTTDEHRFLEGLANNLTKLPKEATMRGLRRTLVLLGRLKQTVPLVDVSILESVLVKGVELLRMFKHPRGEHFAGRRAAYDLRQSRAYFR